MEFVDKALARRFEAAEEMPQVMYARLYQVQRPEIGAAEEDICGGHMIFAGLGSPMGRATGMGFSGTVSGGDLDRVEQFYRSHQAPAQVDVCPLTDPGLLELLKQRKYWFTEFNNVLYRRLEPGDAAFAGLDQVTIRPGQSDEDLAFAAVVERSFFPEGGGPADLTGMLTLLFQMEGAVTLMAEVESTLAACAAGLVIPEHRIIALFGAGTILQFRRRGLQTALLRARMAIAAKAGCEYAVIVTQGGTTSQRNAERLGFRLAYSKATLMKDLDGLSAASG